MTRRPLTLLAFVSVVAATVLSRAQGGVAPGAASDACAVPVREFALPPQVASVSDLELDADGNLIVAGLTSSPDFPTTPDAVKAVCGTEGDAFAMVLTPAGGVRYSTCLGGDASETGAAAVPGPGGALWVLTDAWDCCVPAPCYHCARSRFRPAVWWVTPGSPARSWRTLLPEPDGMTIVDGQAAGLDGSLWVLATTEAARIPTVNAWQPTLAGDSDLLLARYAPGRPEPLLLTYLGGSGGDSGTALAIAPDGDPIVEGGFSPGFPLVPSPQGQSVSAGGPGLARVDASGRWLEYTTSIARGGVTGRISVDARGNVAIAGIPFRADSPPPEVVRARQHEIGLAVFDQHGQLRASAILDDGLDEFSPIDLGTRVSHVALLGRGLLLIVGSYWAEDVISGGFFVTVADPSGSWSRAPLIIRRPSSQACHLEAATSRGRDVYVAAHEWPQPDARHRIVVLRLRPAARDDERAGPGRGGPGDGSR